MATLTVQVENPSVLEQLKNILSLMRGVKIISADSRISNVVVDDMPNAKTLAAMKEAQSGNDAGAVCMDSLESFVVSIER